MPDAPYHLSQTPISLQAWRTSPQFQKDSKRQMMKAVKYTSLRFLTKEQLEALLEEIDARHGTPLERMEDWEDAQMIRHKINGIATIEKLADALKAASKSGEATAPGVFNPSSTQKLQTKIFRQLGQ